ncbi:MAG TPA: substrate-binding domain-containing protein [Azospirillaceae bacterium]|nr:substrate-binding domain-containing protein [Azospirillaceae bacterium]
MIRPTRRALAALLAAGLMSLPVSAQEKPFITVASTTSTEASGLFRHLLPKFTAKTGIEVRVVAQGTGQAMETAKRGDADLVLVHDKPAEEKFVAEGFGTQRRDVMYNDFLIVGPRADPAGVAGGRDAAAALKAIAAAQAPFVSRGDDSGTHRAERRLWSQAGVTPSGGWYREAGSGMGQTLNTAAGMDAYTLTDRASWASFKNKQSLAPAVEGDARLFNQYGVIPVNPAKHPHVKAAPAKAFADWLVSKEGQAAIAEFRIDGQQLFFPNAAPAS